jgi:hypothetical protein
VRSSQRTTRRQRDDDAPANPEAVATAIFVLVLLGVALYAIGMPVAGSIGPVQLGDSANTTCHGLRTADAVVIQTCR